MGSQKQIDPVTGRELGEDENENSQAKPRQAPGGDNAREKVEI